MSMQAPSFKEEEFSGGGLQPLYAFLVSSQVVECLTPDHPIYYVSGSFYLPDVVTNRLFLSWATLGDDLEPSNDAVVLVISASNVDAELQEQWEKHCWSYTWKEYDFMGLVGDPTHGHKLVQGPHTIESQDSSQLLIASMAWKVPGDNSLKQTMLTPRPASRIKVIGQQVWAPRLSGTFGRVLDLVLAHYGDFVNELPITETTILARYIGDVFTSENAGALGLSTPQMRQLRNLHPCLFIYSSDEIRLSEDNWKNCTERYRRTPGWSKDLGLFELDFTAIAATDDALGHGFIS